MIIFIKNTFLERIVNLPNSVESSPGGENLTWARHDQEVIMATQNTQKGIETTATTSTLVVWSRQGAELRATIVADPRGRCKIVFLAGYRPETAGAYRGELPADGELWVVDVVRDTNETNAHKGALIVRLVRQARWELCSLGEEVFGVRRFAPVCLDGEASDVYCSSISREEIKTANAPFRAAEEKRMLWQIGPQNPAFFPTFGRPDETRVDDRGIVTLVYPHGERMTQTSSLSREYAIEPAGWSWDETKGEVILEQSFPEIPGAVLRETVANLSGVRHGWELVPEGMKAEIVAFMTPRMPSPEEVGRQAGAERVGWVAKSLDKLITLVDVLRHPCEKGLVTERYETTSYSVPVSYGDETWYETSSRGVRTACYSTHVVLLDDGVQVGRLEGSVTTGETPEAAVRRMMAKEKEDIKSSLRPASDWRRVPVPFLGELTEAEWSRRVFAAFRAARKEAMSAWGERLTACLRSTQEVWAEYRTLKPELLQACNRRWLSTPTPETMPELRKMVADHREYGRVAAEAEALRKAIRAVENWSEYGDFSRSLAQEFSEWSSSCGDHRIPTDLEVIRQWMPEAQAVLARAETARDEIRQRRDEARRRFAEITSATGATVGHFALPESGWGDHDASLAGRIRGLKIVVPEGMASATTLPGVDRVEAKTLIPGDKALVLYSFGGGTRRYGARDHIQSGLTQIVSVGGSRREPVVVLAIVETPDWHVAWQNTHDGEVTNFVFADRRGIHTLYLDGDDVCTEAWEGVEPTSPSVAEMRAFFGLGSGTLRATTASETVQSVPSTVPEIKTVTFAHDSKRDFRCSCGVFNRMTSGDFARYNSGETIALTCMVCDGVGEVKK